MANDTTCARPTGAQSRLDLKGKAMTSLELIPLDDLEYHHFAQRQVEEYATQHVNAGEWKVEEAQSKAQDELAKLLADSLRGAGHTFLKGIEEGGRQVGWLWISACSCICRRQPQSQAVALSDHGGGEFAPSRIWARSFNGPPRLAFRARDCRAMAAGL